MVNYSPWGFIQSPLGYGLQTLQDFWTLALGHREDKPPIVTKVYEGFGLYPPGTTEKVSSVIAWQKQNVTGAREFWTQNVYGGSDETVPDIANPLEWLEWLKKNWYWLVIGGVGVYLAGKYIGRGK